MIHSPLTVSEESPEEESSYMVMATSRRPSQQILLATARPDSEEEQIFDLEQMSLQGEEQSNVRLRRRYRKANKHRGDYCLVDLKKRSSSFSGGTTNNVKSWKSLTFK